MTGFVKIVFALLLTFSLFGCGSPAEKSMSEPAAKNIQQSAASKEKKEVKVSLSSTANKDKNTAKASINVQKSGGSSVQTNSANSKDNAAVSQSTASTPAAKSVTSKTSTTMVKATATQPASVHKSKSTPAKVEQPQLTVTLSITGPIMTGQKDHVLILPATKVAYKNGDTVDTILSREANLSNILIGSTGSGATLYIQGIEDKNGKWSFYEFDYGPKSGWIFKVNGAEITRSAGITSVKAGDRIEMIYVQ